MERRAHHRYQFAFRVKVQFNTAGRDFVAEAACLEISQAGLTLDCDDALIGALLAQQHYPRTCTLTFSPPAADRLFEIDCQVVRYRRLSQHRYHLVVLFSRFHLGDSTSLAGCLDSSEQRNGDIPNFSRGTRR